MNLCSVLGHLYGPRIRLAPVTCARCSHVKECRHNWKLSLTEGYGENEYIEHRCNKCGDYRGKVGGVELGPAALEKRHNEAWESAQAIGWQSGGQTT